MLVRDQELLQFIKGKGTKKQITDNTETKHKKKVVIYYQRGNPVDKKVYDEVKENIATHFPEIQICTKKDAKQTNIDYIITIEHDGSLVEKDFKNKQIPPEIMLSRQSKVLEVLENTLKEQPPQLQLTCAVDRVPKFIAEGKQLNEIVVKDSIVIIGNLEVQYGKNSEFSKVEGITIQI